MTNTAARRTTLRHSDLCRLAVKWLKRPKSGGGHGCQVAVSECRADYTGEVPDAIGFRAGFQAGTVVVECKSSRTDFLADRAKPHRAGAVVGMGTWRYYMAPAGLIAAADLPERWGLLEVNPRGHIAIRAGAVAAEGLNAYAEALEAYRHSADTEREQALLVRLLARLGDAEAMNLRVRTALDAHARLGREVDELRRQVRRESPLRFVLESVVDVMARCDPDACLPGAQQATDEEWDAALAAARSVLGSKRIQ